MTKDNPTPQEALEWFDSVIYSLPMPKKDRVKADAVRKALQSQAEKDRVIKVMKEALKHYTSVVAACNDTNSFAPTAKDIGFHARQALAEAEKLEV